MLMKHSKTNDYKKVFSIYFVFVVLLVILGLVMSLKNTGKLMYKTSVIIRDSSVMSVSLGDAMAKSLTGHILYCFFALFGNLPGLIACGIYAGFKAFSIGAVVGLTVKHCALKKSLTICFCAFVSNIFVFPIYAILFVMNLKYSTAVYTNNLCSHSILKGYFSYVTRIFVVFILLCAVDFVQNALGIFAVNFPG